MSTNRSFWQDKVGIPGTIRNDPIPTTVADHQLLIKVQAWALNPADHIVQDISLPFMKYPIILGEDVAGTVELVGSTASSKFKVGDRVLGYAQGTAPPKPEQGGFQDYVVLNQTMVCKIPDSMSFVEASVFPLCISTAAHGLFSKDYLGLPFPEVHPISTGKSILIWGGSSGVGSNAIQLAKAAGFEVLATCSARNFDTVKSLGAHKVFDYNSATAIDDIVSELDKGECAGIFQAAGNVTGACQVSHRSKQKLFVASAVFVPPGVAPEGVEAKFLAGGADSYKETSPATFGGFLPEALAKEIYKIAPAPEVLPTRGVEGIQEGLNLLKKGVSAKKIVVQAK